MTVALQDHGRRRRAEGTREPGFGLLVRGEQPAHALFESDVLAAGLGQEARPLFDGQLGRVEIDLLLALRR